MPQQKEVIHLAIGTLPHHVTTHFFNQQASHFDYGAGNAEASSSAKTLLDPAVDFQEGIGSLSGQPTFFPRQVVVDFRDSLGQQWSAYNAVYGEAGEEADDEEFGDAKLLPESAAQEGLRAWHAPAEIQFANDKGVSQRRVLYDSDDDTDDDSDEEGGNGTNHDTGATDVASEAEKHLKAKSMDQDLLGEECGSESNGKTRQRQYNISPAMYAHNPHHPRGVRSLPRYFQSGALVPANASAEAGQAPFSAFEMGVNLSRDMERSSPMLDDHIRWFAEDSDSLQAFNLYASISDGFAGMASETLNMLADDYPKTPVVGWGLASPPTRHADPDSRQARLRRTNAILSLWSLSSASLYVPIELPEELAPRAPTAATSHLKQSIDWTSSYHVASLFGAFIDTALLPTRLHAEAQRRPTAALTSTLNWRRDTPIAILGGCMPIPLLAPVASAARILDPIEALLASRGYDPRKLERGAQAPSESAEQRASRGAKTISDHYLSLAPKADSKNASPPAFASAFVARDGDPKARDPTREALEAWSHLDEPAGRVDVLPIQCNVRSASCPQLFRNLTSQGRPLPEQDRHTAPRRKVESLPVMAALRTTPATAHLLADARRFIDERLVRGYEPLYAYGLGGARGRSGAGQAASDDTEGPLGGRDGMFEVRERLEELLGAYDDGRQGLGDLDDNVGTDEEVDADSDSDWDLAD